MTEPVGLWWDDLDEVPNYAVVNGVTLWMSGHTRQYARSGTHKKAVLDHMVSEYKRCGLTYQTCAGDRALIRERLRLSSKKRQLDKGKATWFDVELIQIRIEIMELMPYDIDRRNGWLDHPPPLPATPAPPAR